MGTCSTRHCKTPKPKLKEFLLGTTPPPPSNFKIPRFLNLFFCVFWRKLGFRLHLLTFRARGKETPPNKSISIFYNKKTLWTTGSLFSLSCSWKETLSLGSSFSRRHQAPDRTFISAVFLPVCTCKWNVLGHLLPMDTRVACCTVPSPPCICSFLAGEGHGGRRSLLPLPPPPSI